MRNVSLFFIALCLLLVPMLAQDAGKQDTAKKAAQGPPANLKVLKVTTSAEVGQVMRTFTAALGVQCSYCHMAGNYASDENPKKDEARKMIRMTQQINGNFTDNKMYVSCYTCHRGEAQPKTAPEPKG